MSFLDLEAGGKNFWKGNNNNKNNNRHDYEMSALEDEDDFQLISKILQTNIQEMNFNVGKINEWIKYLGINGKDTHELREQLRETMETTRNLAAKTNDKFRELGQLPRNTNEQEKLFRKLKNDLQNCNKSIREVTSLAQKKTTTSVPKKSYNAYEEEEKEDREPTIQQAKKSELMEIDGDLDIQDAIIEEREEDINQIEQDVRAVNSMFIDLADLVQEQAPMIESIEANITQSVTNVSKGVTDLQKAQEHQRTGRSLMCWVMLILVIIIGAGIIALILGFSIKSLTG